MLWKAYPQFIPSKRWARCLIWIRVQPTDAGRISGPAVADWAGGARGWLADPIRLRSGDVVTHWTEIEEPE